MKFIAKRVWYNIKRRLRSIVDTFKFGFIRLSNNFFLWLACLVVLILFSILFPKDYGWLAKYGPLLGAALAYVGWLFRRNGVGIIRTYHFEKDDSYLRRIEKILPSQTEKEFDFYTTKSPLVADGPITISNQFNKNCISNPDWDCKVVERKLKDRNESIVLDLKRNAYFLKQYIFKKFANAFFKKGLINEEKIAFCSDFHPNVKEIEVFQTDYFMSLCSSDLSTTNVVRYEGGKRISVSSATERAPFNILNGELSLIDFSDTVHPVSLHFGIEVIVISNDLYLRLAVQSIETEFSQGMRAPLASGSMDWKDLGSTDGLKDLIRKAAKRELTEEWGKKHHRLPKIEIERIEPIGYFRMPHRGGKPQFVALAKIKNPDAHLRPDITEVYADDSIQAKALFKVNNLDSLIKAVKKIIEEDSSLPDSVPLYGAMLCLKTFLEFRPELAVDVIGY